MVRYSFFAQAHAAPLGRIDYIRRITGRRCPYSGAAIPELLLLVIVPLLWFVLLVHNGHPVPRSPLNMALWVLLALAVALHLVALGPPLKA